MNKKARFTKTNVAGTTYQGRQKVLEELECVDKSKLQVLLEHEKDNPHDENAIKVVVLDDKATKHHIGYISKNLNKTLLEAVTDGNYTISDFYVVGGGDDGFNYGAELSIIYSSTNTK